MSSQNVAEASGSIFVPCPKHGGVFVNKSRRGHREDAINKVRSSSSSDSSSSSSSGENECSACQMSNEARVDDDEFVDDAEFVDEAEFGAVDRVVRHRRRHQQATQVLRKRRTRPLLPASDRVCSERSEATFRKFCKQTSLHGWRYIAGEKTSRAKHSFWAIIVALSMVTAAFFLYNNTVDFLDATVMTTVDTMTVPLSEVFFPSVVVCNINQVRKSFFEELGIYDNETVIRRIYYDYIEGKNSKNAKSKSKGEEQQIALHEQILKEYLERMNKTAEGEQSINWVTHQKCKDMFILSKFTIMSELSDFSFNKQPSSPERSNSDTISLSTRLQAELENIPEQEDM